ncbi:MAG: hypothetical protein WD794_02485 [Mycobacteriales bacterium]
MTAAGCRALTLDWPGVQNGDGLVGRMSCACGQVCLFRLKPLTKPFTVEGAGHLHDQQHAAAVWLVCHELLSGTLDPVAAVSALQETAPSEWVSSYAQSQGWSGR